MKRAPLALAIALLASCLVVFPATAAEEEKKEKPVVVPEDGGFQISDPFGDANTRPNDWQTGGPQFDGTDILKVWFTNDPETITGNIQVAAAPSGQVANWYRIRVNPATSENPAGGCIRFEAQIAGNSSPGRPDSATLFDDCDSENATDTEGAVKVHAIDDGTAVVSMTFPRTASPFLEKDKILWTPVVNAYALWVALGTTMDSTVAGSPYTVRGKLVAPKKKEEPAEGEEPSEEPSEEEPAEKPKPAPKKKKGKGCPAYVPGEEGKEAKTTVVTDAATAEKPVEVKLETAEGLPEVHVTHAFHNVQVDSAAATTGLYASVEFGFPRDLDLYLKDAEGKEWARSAGFNATPVGPFDGTGSGGHSTMDAENLDGVIVPDCSGFTLDIASYLSEGTEVTVKLWLGKGEYEPKPE